MLVEQLERVNISQMECDGKIAFWINIHNALVMHVIFTLIGIAMVLIYQFSAHNFFFFATDRHI